MPSPGSHRYVNLDDAPFHGAKLLLTQGGRLLTCLRDDVDDIPFPAHWDLPGGGREGHERPLDCALRELSEEFGLRLGPERLRGHVFPSHQRPEMLSWLFIGPIEPSQIATIRFGDEGQEWQMMPVTEFLAHPRAVPHFKQWIKAIPGQIAQRRGCDAAS